MQMLLMTFLLKFDCWHCLFWGYLGKILKGYHNRIEINPTICQTFLILLSNKLVSPLPNSFTCFFKFVHLILFLLLKYQFVLLCQYKYLGRFQIYKVLSEYPLNLCLTQITVNVMVVCE